MKRKKFKKTKPIGDLIDVKHELLLKRLVSVSRQETHRIVRETNKLTKNKLHRTSLPCAKRIRRSSSTTDDRQTTSKQINETYPIVYKEDLKDTIKMLHSDLKRRPVYVHKNLLELQEDESYTHWSAETYLINSINTTILQNDWSSFTNLLYQLAKKNKKRLSSYIWRMAFVNILASPLDEYGELLKQFLDQCFTDEADHGEFSVCYDVLS